MTRVGRHDKKFKITFQKYIHSYHITQTHTTFDTDTHTTLRIHNRHSESPRHTRFRHNKVKNFGSSSFGHQNFTPS